jgi:hypothetical protein
MAVMVDEEEFNSDDPKPKVWTHDKVFRAALTLLRFKLLRAGVGHGTLRITEVFFIPVFI